MNEPDVAVLYGDQSIVRAEWADREALKTTDVLAISLCCHHRPAAELKSRYQATSYHDFYVLTWDDSSCWLGGYDDNEAWFGFDEPWEASNITWRFPYLLAGNSILFEGVQVPKEEWEAALAKFDDRDGVMF